MKHHFLLAVAAAVLLPSPLLAQVAPISSTADSVAEALPADVLAAVRAAVAVKTIYPVTGAERFTGQILKADEIVFAPGASLTLTATERPWIVIVAKKWKFADVAQWVKIAATAAPAAAGAQGARGSNGADNWGETGRHGNPGYPGAPGGTGGRGATVRLPRIYLVGGEFTSPDGAPLPGALRLALSFAGVPGGAGGIGGAGGNGGHGGNGKEGATGPFDCHEGPGPGGDGGAAGRGGAGGDGGTGGNGADLVYVSLAEGIEQLSYARVINTEGYGGSGGRAGRVGSPGGAGSGAGRNGWCGSSGPGSAGAYPSPADGGPGRDGDDGHKGSVTAITVRSLAPLF